MAGDVPVPVPNERGRGPLTGRNGLEATTSSQRGTDHGMMRELNRGLVLDLIRNQAPVSRAALARITSLAKPTVSGIVEDLIADGLVREIGTGTAAAGGGRPPILLELNRRAHFFLGIQIGIQRTNLVVADALGEELERHVINTPRGAPRRALDRIAKEGRALLREAGTNAANLSAVGVCIPGLVDLETGVCLIAPNLGWRDVPVSEHLTRMLDAPVFVVNTADAAVVVESTEGAATDAANVVLLYVGRGVGASVFVDGRIMHGHRGLSVEIGHCYYPGATGQCECGKTGCLETLADGPALARGAVEQLRAGRASSMSSLDPESLTAADVGHAASQGDELALELLAGAGQVLGIAASWLINLFNPQVLLVGGGVASAGAALLDPLRATVMEHALSHNAEDVEIRPWTQGRDAGVTGAIRVAMQNSQSYYRVVFQH